MKVPVEVLRAKRDALLPYAVRPPCRHEGAIIEWCTSRCRSTAENHHVRDCAVHEKCTRGFVSLAVRSCERCPDRLD